MQGNIKTAMSENDFDQLVLNIKANLLQILKVASLKNVFRNTANNFTSNQVYQLVSLANAEDNRLELAKLSYRSVVDKNNFTVVYPLLLESESKNSLAVYVRDYRE